MADTLPPTDGTLIERLGITVEEVTPRRTTGSMPVAGNTQPHGLLHGGATAALADQDHVAISARHARAAIEQLRAEVKAPKIYPSCANFVLIDCGRPSAPVYEKLLRMGVIVRPMGAFANLLSCIRVSVASHQDMPRVIAALNQALA